MFGRNWRATKPVGRPPDQERKTARRAGTLGSGHIDSVTAISLIYATGESRARTNLADRKPKDEAKAQTAPASPVAQILTPPSRVGRKAISGYFSPELSLGLHTCARRNGLSLQHLMTEAFDGHHRVAFRTRRDDPRSTGHRDRRRARLAFRKPDPTRQVGMASESDYMRRSVRSVQAGEAQLR
jgi:hypothetical protein